MKRIPSSIDKKLEARKQQHALRQLMDAHHLVDFYSNDYLGMARRHSTQHLQEGSTGSRLLSGNSKKSEAIERDLAGFFQQEAALFFNSGYDANLGFFSSVPQRGDTVIYDELSHASIRDGIQLGYAHSFSFKHNDTEELKAKIKRAKGTVYVVVEAIYSMDGDTAPLQSIASICEMNGAFLVIDEAHSGGIYGAAGRGLVSELELDDAVFAKVITFGKAYGSHGAIVLGSEQLKQYLINFARPLMYSTALSPHTQERIREMVGYVATLDSERQNLRRLIDHFKKSLDVSKYEWIESNSAIQSLLIPENQPAIEWSEKITKKGFATKAILSPTVPKGKERLRFCLHSYNTAKEIDALSEIING
ncbi:MAG: 8-amino-7-oxononanoate synthase [Crocinitomicaceae bacterium]